MRTGRRILAVGSLLVVGCQGTVVPGQGDGLGPEPERPGGPPGSPPSGPAPGPVVEPAPAPRLVRLTHAQWTRTVHDLFGLDDTAPDWAAGFRDDAGSGGYRFGSGVEDRVVDEVLATAYGRAAEEVAVHLTPGGELGRLARYLPDGGDDRARAAAFIEAMGPLVHRRPVPVETQRAYLSVFDVGAAHPQGASPLVGGLRLVVQAFLTSPYFLHRFEASTEVVDGRIPLDRWELAARLSYALWDTMPDAELRAAAASGELSTTAGVRAQAERMVRDPKVEPMVLRFHAHLLELDRYAGIAPDPGDHPEVGPELPASCTEETRRVVRDALVGNRGWRHLLTTNQTWVDAQLARLYGVAAPSEGFAKVELPAHERRGLLTQIGFLASHATRFQPDPIHRGVFLTQYIACNVLGAPPADLPPLPPPEGRTNREVVADHTERPGTSCAGCHATLINPYGFAFEGYDAAGRVRLEDAGRPVNTFAEPILGGERVPVAGAIELVEQMAASSAVHACYARHWVEQTLGRPVRPEDTGLVEQLGAASLEGASIRELLVELVSSPAFTHRSQKEED